MIEVIKQLENYIHEILSETVSAKKWSGVEKLPLFLTKQYEFFKMTLLGRAYIIAIERETETQSPAKIRKQLEIVHELAEIDVVYVAHSMPSWNKSRLIGQKQSFIVPGKQFYLPLIGMDLRDLTRLPAKKSPVIKLGPSTTRILLFILYNSNRDYWTQGELAENLGISAMSVSRSFDSFSQIELFSIDIEKKTRVLRCEKSRLEIWKQAEMFLRSPVIKKIFVDITKVPINVPMAGLTALAQRSMLSAPENPEYALSLAEWKQLKQKKLIREVPTADVHVTVFEIWRYDPKEFANEGTVDPLSLSITLKDCDNPRIEAALEEMMENIVW